MYQSSQADVDLVVIYETISKRMKTNNILTYYFSLNSDQSPVHRKHLFSNSNTENAHLNE